MWFRRRNGISETYNELRLTLPSGREVVGRIPVLKRQLHFLELLERIGNEDRQAMTRLIMDFPREVQLEHELNELTVPEFIEVVQSFFGHRGSATDEAEPTAAAATPADAPAPSTS